MRVVKNIIFTIELKIQLPNGMQFFSSVARYFDQILPSIIVHRRSEQQNHNLLLYLYRMDPDILWCICMEIVKI